ncbi:tRNA (adenosine(37)-N6)-threonylcarbamoyltransferase complex ATPase subunit type 1 TsaE [Salinicoccus hispanicus]|uniref:tRNA threonylcarbamoyladenosine biosynthesis protein TsaE n=1 Tax=Salinicoccus hispanicus TaxID=157225 RepID=A0A6N8U324_9STAP|nr:tRNA (adenosine(37)-N6)-threonylcarbamoyltransferase complex ATPase subunit type 1 TsaE [Salinicoccus hispanicus]MXQ52153.1 tRNA (adenosine(37)-N6)-threonylcarbamoyltransferase complex ATPase subunit type 1 TsaE [Salinicoccus hispanicus]
MEYTIQINDLGETEKLARIIADNMESGSVILLSGDLGAGKTTFTQFLGRSLGVKRRMSSPTFNIIKTYRGNQTIHHMDCYRLEDSGEDLGFDEYFNGEDISIVEWPQFIEDFLPDERLSIHITVADEETRVFSFNSSGTEYTKIMEALAYDFPSN